MVTDLVHNYLTGQLLIAMPAMGDPRFSKSVIYMCVHNEEGAMGLIVNKLADELSFAELLTQLDIESLEVAPQLPIHFGGPVRPGADLFCIPPNTTKRHDRGRRRHGADGNNRYLARHHGLGAPKFLLALGYAGWGGQLDGEIRQNAWLHVPDDPDLTRWITTRNGARHRKDRRRFELAIWRGWTRLAVGISSSLSGRCAE